MAARAARLRGSCLCGLVAYEVENDFQYALICHCSGCRRATGSGSKPFAGIAREYLAVVEGEDRIMRYGGETGHDIHCGRCGSLLYSVVQDGRMVHVTLGTLIDDPAIRPAAHIFTGSKAAWDTICDDLPQFDELPPD